MPAQRFPTPAPRRRQDDTKGPNTDKPASQKYNKNLEKQKDTPRPAPHPRDPRDKKKEPQKRPLRPEFRPNRPTFDPKKNIPDSTKDIPQKENNTPRPDQKPVTDVPLQPGIKPITELLESNPAKIDSVFLRKGRKGPETDKIIDLCREHGVRFSLVDDAFLDRLWRGRHQGVIARLFETGFIDLPDMLNTALDAPLPLILALDQVQDPGNAGTLARTLYAFGGAGLVVPKHNGVYLGAAAAKVSAGALDKLPVAKVSNLAQALDMAVDAGYTVYGADATKKTDASPTENVFTFIPRLPAVLVLGSEEGGLRPIVRKRCAAIISIPFAREFDSLNVAQAGAIVISAFANANAFSR